MPFMHEDLQNKKGNNEKINSSIPSEDKDEKPNNKNVDTIASAPEVDLLKEKDFSEPEKSLSADEILAQKKAKEKEMEMLGDPLFSWQAQEYTHYEKSILWYLIVISITLLAIIAAIYLRQWIFIAVVIMFAIVFVQYGRRKPQVKDYSIYENAVKIDGDVYPFKRFKSFWFIEAKDDTNLSLEPLKRVSPIAVVHLSDVKIDDLRTILADHLPEQKREESLIERASRKLKF